MFRKYSSDRDIKPDLFEELERMGYSIKKTDETNFLISRGRGSVIFSSNNKDGDSFIFSMMRNVSPFVLADISREKEIDKVIKRLDGKDEDILKGALPDKDRKVMRIGGSLIGFSTLIGGATALASYLIYGDKQYIFDQTKMGTYLAVALGLCILTGFVIVAVKTNKMNQNT